jgi:hypothetical protein
MQQMEKVIIAVSQHTVLQAELAIVGCISCTDRATVPLTRVLDKLRKQPPGRVDYILPVLAICPKCKASLDEWALVAPKDYDRGTRKAGG